MVRLFAFRIFLLLFTLLITASFSHRYAPGSKIPVDQTDNVLAGTSWKLNGVPFADKDQTEYFLSTYDPLSYDSQMGHFISFDETTFMSDYNAPCGMDCFTNVSGEYHFESNLQVHIKVLRIDRHGFCDKGSETLDRDHGLFDLVKQGTGWKLVKSK
jgi:hypothetical protein